MTMLERKHWLAIVGTLLLMVVVLLLAWPKPGPDHVVVRVVNGPTVISTQIVPLR